MQDMLINKLKKSNKTLEADRDKWKAIAEVKTKAKKGNDEALELLIETNKRLNICLTDISNRYDDIYINYDLLNIKKGE